MVESSSRQDSVAVIPARSGSKGIEGKNMRTVGGLSLLGRAILSAKASPNIREVYVSSDGDNILAHSQIMGAIPVRRPSELATDVASSESAVLHFLELHKFELEDIKNIFLIQATSPFLNSRALTVGADLLTKGVYDSLFSGFRTHNFIWRKMDETMEPVNHATNFRKRRQEIPAEYAENGSFYGFDKDGFLENKSRFFGRIGMVLVPKHDWIDVDDEKDLEIAQALFAAGLGSNPSPPQHPRVIFCDFDGVLTDNTFWTGSDEIELVRLNKSDGLATSDIVRAGCPVVIISGDTGGHIRSRATKLGIESIIGVSDKKKAVLEWCEKRGVRAEEAVFIGNDENDIDAMLEVGIVVVPADAPHKVRRHANLVFERGDSYGIMRRVHDHFFGMGD